MTTQPGVKCGTCPAFERLDDEPGKGKCRGDIPACFIMMKQNPITQIVSPSLQSGWRVVHEDDDWCAKHPAFDWGIEPIVPCGTGGVA